MNKIKVLTPSERLIVEDYVRRLVDCPSLEEKLDLAKKSAMAAGFTVSVLLLHAVIVLADDAAKIVGKSNK
jgi:hypothetical protein